MALGDIRTVVDEGVTYYTVSGISNRMFTSRAQAETAASLLRQGKDPAGLPLPGQAPPPAKASRPAPGSETMSSAQPDLPSSREAIRTWEYGSPEAWEQYEREGAEALQANWGYENFWPGAGRNEYVPYPDKPLGATDQYDQDQRSLIEQIAGNGEDYISTLDDLVGEQRGLQQRADAFDTDYLNEYRSNLNSIEFDPLSLASSNPADVARQGQAYGMAAAAAGGSLDQFSDPEDVASQAKNRDLLWELAQSPELTAKERFIYEQQRSIEEQDRRAAMGAALKNLASRGMLGSGHEIGANLGAQQITSQNRLLGDLGALSSAVDRQMNSINMHGQISTAMRNAGDAMKQGNANRRMSGINTANSTATAMRNASDDLAMFNSNQTNQRSRDQVNLDWDRSNALLDAGWNYSDRSYGRGQDSINLAGNVAATTQGVRNEPIGLSMGLNSETYGNRAADRDLITSANNKVVADKARRAAMGDKQALKELNEGWGA